MNWEQVAMFRPKERESDNYCTPQEVLIPALEMLGEIDVDPCTNEHSMTRPRLAGWGVADDALAQPTWALDGEKTRIWLNPPYSNPGPFLERLASECREHGCVGLALVKHDHTTRWFASVKHDASALCLWRRRLRFDINGSPAPSPANFPSTVLLFCNGVQWVKRFRFSFGACGWVVE